MKVKDIMTARTLKSCSPETKLHAAAKTMKAANCGALPVVDKDKNVVGLVTDRDIALSMTKRQSKQAEPLAVADVMAKKVHTIQAEEEVSAALRQMRVKQVGRVPVVDANGKLKGMVTMHNLIASAADAPDAGIEVGSIAAPGENLIKTIQSLTARYNKKTVKGRRNNK